MIKYIVTQYCMKNMYMYKLKAKIESQVVNPDAKISYYNERYNDKTISQITNLLL
jgi:hypothetical protein